MPQSQFTMAPRAVLLVLALALAQVAHGYDWEPCGPQQYFTTSKVDVLPNPPTTGEDLTFKIWGQTGNTTVQRIAASSALNHKPSAH